MFGVCRFDREFDRSAGPITDSFQSFDPVYVLRHATGILTLLHWRVAASQEAYEDNFAVSVTGTDRNRFAVRGKGNGSGDQARGSGYGLEHLIAMRTHQLVLAIDDDLRGINLLLSELRGVVIRFLARNPGVEAGEVSERARMVVPAGI